MASFGASGIIESASVSSASSTPNICSTEICKSTSNSISQSIDDTVNPCENFFQFACGNFASQIDVEHISESEMHRAIFKSEMISFLEKSSEEESIGIQMMRNFYKSCADKETSEAQGNRCFFPNSRHVDQRQYIIMLSLHQVFSHWLN